MGRDFKTVPHFVGRSKGRWKWDLVKWANRVGWCVVICRNSSRTFKNFNIDKWIEIGPGRMNRTRNGKMIYHAVVWRRKKKRSSFARATYFTDCVYDGGNPLRYTTDYVIMWRAR